MNKAVGSDESQYSGHSAFKLFQEVQTSNLSDDDKGDCNKLMDITLRKPEVLSTRQSLEYIAKLLKQNK